MTKSIVFAVIVAMAMCGGARADECDAVIADLFANINGLEVGDRIPTPGQPDIVQIKSSSAEGVKLTCPASGQPGQIEAAWHSAYPPPAFFDFVSAAGAIVTPVSAVVIRRGILNCQKQALTLGAQDQITDLAETHFACHVTTDKGGATTIKISSSRDRTAMPADDPPSSDKPAKRKKQ